MLLHVFAIILLFSTFALVISKSEKWDFFVFTQQWPTAECTQAHDQCTVPSYVHSWTIHGLWPTRAGGSEGPSNCNRSLPFNPKEIQRLEKQLDTYWPNLYNKTKHYKFWKDEWEKHGTCATSLPATKNEYMYFQKALDLNQKFNIQTALEKHNIKPSLTTSYKILDIKQALVKSFPGVQPFVSCAEGQVRSRKEKLVIEIEICFKKDFTPEKCTQPPRKNCANETGVFLIPKVHSQP